MNPKRFARLLVPVFFASTIHSQLLATPRDPFAQDFIQPETPTYPRQIRVELETFTVPMIEAHTLITSDLDDDQIRAAILKSVSNGTGRLETFMILKSRSHSGCRSMQVISYPSPENYDFDLLPEKLTLADPLGLENLTKELLSKPDASAPIITLPPNAAKVGLGGVIPTSFNVRELGENLEIDPILSEDVPEYFNLNIASQSNVLLGHESYDGIHRPVLRSIKQNHSVAGKSGKAYLLTGNCTAIETGAAQFKPDQSMRLTFATLRTTEVKPPSAARIANPKEPFRYQFEVFSLPQADAQALIQEHSTDEILYQKISQAVQNKTARMETLLSTKCETGSRARVEQMTDHFHNGSFARSQKLRALTISKPKQLEELLSPTPPDQSVNAIVGPAPPLPKDVITTQIGDSLEVAPYVSEDGGIVDANLVASSIRLICEANYGGAKHPIFEKRQLNIGTTMQVNSPNLLGTFNRPTHTGVDGGNTEDRIWLAFLTAYTNAK